MKKTKRFIAALLSLLMLLPLVTPAYAADFTDTGSHWARGEIDRWAELGIIAGSDGLFRPDESITRAEMAIIIDRLMKYRSTSQNSFTDLPDTWYTDAVLRASTAGIILGDAGLVRPTDYITRQEAVVMLCRALGITELTGDTEFADDASIASWAKPFVKAMSRRELISGVGNNLFAPAERITRASVVKLLDNAISAIYSSSGGYSENASGTVIINSAGVTLNDMSISGDLIIAEGVDNGGVALHSVNVTGTTFVRGGSNAIELSNSSIPALQVEKRGAAPRIYAANGTTVKNTFVKSSVILEEADFLTGGGFEDLQTDSANALQLDLIGSFGRLTQSSPEAKYRITGHVADINILAFCEFAGDFSYRTMEPVGSSDYKINGQSMGGGSGLGFHGLTLVSSTADGSPRVGGVLTAATIASSNTAITYRWYSAVSNLPLDSADWTLIVGADSKNYTLPPSMSGLYIKAEAQSSTKKLMVKTSVAVGDHSSGSSFVSIENHSSGSETSVRFVFTKPLALAGADGALTAVENNYDFKNSEIRWFSVRVGSASSSLDEGLIASTIYSASDNSITVTLSGDASAVKNRVAVKLAATMYNTDGASILPADCPTAVRTAGCVSWQNGGVDGSGPFDTTAPIASIAASGNTATVLRIAFNEPLGYISGGICRPAPDNYDFKNSATSGVASLKLDGETPADSSVLIASSVYSAESYTLTITLKSVGADKSVTLTPSMSFHDIYGNVLTPASIGVFYRRANDVKWSLAADQQEADTAASGRDLNGEPAFMSGMPARYGLELVAGPGTLNLTAGLQYSWYRSADTSYSTGDKLVGSGTKYTPSEEDIGQYIILVATSSVIPGIRELRTDKVEKSAPTVTGNTVVITLVADGVYSLDSISGLFETNSDGARKYKFPKDAKYTNASLNSARTILTVKGTGEFELQVEIAESSKFSAYTGTATATLKISDPAPRTIPITALSIPEGQNFAETDLGRAWFNINLSGAENKVYLKNIPAASTENFGEALGRGEAFTGAGYTMISGTRSGNVLRGSAILSGSVSGAAGGKYYVVETTSDDKVVSTGLVTLTNRNILARISIVNNCSASPLNSYALTSAASATTGNRYFDSAITGEFRDIYVPRDTTYITFYVNRPSGTLAPSGPKYSAALTFSACRATTIVSDDLLK